MRLTVGQALVRFLVAQYTVVPVDAHKHNGVALVGDARRGLSALHQATGGWSADRAHIERARTLAAAWDVPFAEVSAVESTRAARTAYAQAKADQRTHL